MSSIRQATARDLAGAMVAAATTAGAASTAVRGADWRLGVVTAVNADGTVDVGEIRARRLEDAYLNPTVGDTICLTQNSAGNWLAIGRTATNGGGAWQTYTPVWTASGTNPSLGNGTLVGRYQKIGRTVVCHINLTPGSTTTFGTQGYSLTIPFQAANNGCTYIGSAHLLSSPSRWGGQFVISPGATLGGPYMTVANATASLAAMTGTQPATFASGHALRITAVYESAT